MVMDIPVKRSFFQVGFRRYSTLKRKIFRSGPRPHSLSSAAGCSFLIIRTLDHPDAFILQQSGRAPSFPMQAASPRRMMSWSQQQSLVGLHQQINPSTPAGGMYVPRQSVTGSSVEGGLFAAPPPPDAHQVAVSQYRRAALPAAGGDFLDRLAAAEARDAQEAARLLGQGPAAGERKEMANARITPDERLQAATLRTTQRSRAAQATVECYAEYQRERAMAAARSSYSLTGDSIMQKQLPEGGVAAGSKSKNLIFEEQRRAEQAEIAERARCKLQRQEREGQAEFQARIAAEQAARHAAAQEQQRRRQMLAARKQEQERAASQEAAKAQYVREREQAWLQARGMTSPKAAARQQHQRSPSPRGPARGGPSPRAPARGGPSPHHPRAASPHLPPSRSGVREVVPAGAGRPGSQSMDKNMVTKGMGNPGPAIHTSVVVHAPPGGHSSISFG